MAQATQTQQTFILQLNITRRFKKEDYSIQFPRCQSLLIVYSLY